MDTTLDLERGLDRLPPIFASCLDVDNERISTVTEIDGHVYATNGHLVVRAPTPQGWDVPNPERPILGIPSVFRHRYEPEPIPLPPFDAKDCTYCIGARFRGETPCSRCDVGYVSASDCDCPSCDGWHKCGECDGKGTIPPGPCRHCKRSGVNGRGEEGIEVAPDIYISERYLSLLTKYGASVYLPADRPPSYGRGPDKDTPAIRFVVDGAEGRLMIMDSRYCEAVRRDTTGLEVA